MEIVSVKIGSPSQATKVNIEDPEQVKVTFKDVVVNGGGGSVKSVNGQTGDVVLDAAAVGALPNTTEIPSKTSDLQNDSGFLTEHQSLAEYAKTDHTHSEYVTDSELTAKGYAKQTEVTQLSEELDGKLNADQLSSAVNDALATAKESGEFDGEDGGRGPRGYSIIKSSANPTSGTYTYNGDTYKYRISKSPLATVKGEAPVVNDVVLYSYYLYLIEAVDTSYCYFNTRTAIRGASGAAGVTPHIGDNGNWFIGDTDTGVKAEGSDANVTSETIETALGYEPAKQSDLEKQAEEIADLKTPSYVIAEAKETAEKVLSHQSENSFTLAWLSDLHIGNKYQVDGLWTTDETSNIEASQGLHEMSKTSPCDVIAIGGDLASGTITNTHEEGLDQLDGCIEILRPATFYTPTLYLIGNHDDAPWRATADRLTRAELFSRLGRKNLLCGAVTNGNDKGCLYGYKDFESQKMRVIYLDTHDKNGWESINCVSGTNSNSDYMDACNISAKQLDWFANTALDFSDKPNPSEWGVVVLSHTQLTIHSGTGTYTANGKSYNYNTDNAITIMTAYLNKGSGSITLNGETANYDFSGLTEKAYLYCHICGHQHAYKFAELGGKKIPSIGCPNTRAGGERVSDDGNTYTKTAGTGESCSFNVITIDRQNGKIYADNHGAGVDREFDVVVYSSYTNLLPSATKPVASEGSAMDTTLFNNGLGYANNTRISGVGHSAGTGYVATGYIPYKIKEDGTFGTIYIKGATLDTSLSYVRFVNLQHTSAAGVRANKATVGGSTSANTMLATYFTIEELGTDYYKLTPTSGAGFSANTFAFMISLKGSGENLIITVDEPID